MGRVSKEEQWRMQGMWYALRVAEAEGIDGLKEDLRRRGATNAPLGVNSRKAEQYKKQLEDEMNETLNRKLHEQWRATVETVLTTVLVVMHDDFGWGEKRLKQLRDKLQYHFEVVHGGFATMDDLEQILTEECGIDIHGKEVENDTGTGD